MFNLTNNNNKNQGQNQRGISQESDHSRASPDRVTDFLL